VTDHGCGKEIRMCFQIEVKKNLNCAKLFQRYFFSLLLKLAIVAQGHRVDLKIRNHLISSKNAEKTFSGLHLYFFPPNFQKIDQKHSSDSTIKA